MLARRMQNILKVRDRVALLRLYLAGYHGQPNPKIHHDTSLNQRISLQNINLPICTTQRWFVDTIRKNEIIFRACHTRINNNDVERRTENGFARSVLATSKDRKSIGVPLEKIDNVTDEEAQNILSQDWNNASVDKILEAFRKLSCHAKISLQQLDNDKHKNILAALTANLSNCSDEQLHKIFQCFALWEGISWVRSSTYTDFLAQLDMQLIDRLTNWTFDEALLICDYLHQLLLCRKIKFPTVVLKKLGKKPRNMSPSNFLHFMFLLNVGRIPPINMYEVEYYFDQILEQFTANELGVVAMGFFKTQTPLRDQKIITRMQMKLLEEINTIDDISLSAIMKITRYSTGLKDLKVLYKILEEVKPRVPKLALQSLVHIAQAAACVQCYNAELIEMIVQRFMTDIDKARLKDLERFTLALSVFSYNRKAPIYTKIVESLQSPKRAAELQRYATLLPTTLLYLSNASVFPMDLMKSVLQPEFLQRVYNNNAYKIGYSIFALECNLRTTFPEYDGPFLQDGIRQFIAKKYLKDIMAKASSGPSDKLILGAAHVCKLVLDSDKAVHIDYILPQFMKPDIIICLDEKGNLVHPEPILSKLPFGITKRPPPETSHFKWIAIVLATQNQMIRDTNRYIGTFTTKLRQLRHLGYEPIVLTHIEWRNLESLEAKEDYLRKILPISFNRKVSVEAI